MKTSRVDGVSRDAARAPVLRLVVDDIVDLRLLADVSEPEPRLEDGEIISGTVTGKVKGGLTVMVNGIRAFLPGSLVDVRPIKDTTPYEGKTLEFKVIKLDRKRNNVVLSRRAVVEATLGEERQKLMETLKEGAIVNGIVKNITDYGAFVDLGGIDGLLHVTDMSWKRVNHPSQVLAVGDTVKVQIVKINPDTQRISLGFLHEIYFGDTTTPDPNPDKHTINRLEYQPSATNEADLMTKPLTSGEKRNAFIHTMLL